MFCGPPPGTGKTSFGVSIAEALGRVFVRISLGGIRDEAEIRGHRRTYIGALPGRIIQTMKRAKKINPIFMLDEIDKMGNDYRGDPADALLEILDSEQNSVFSDHYLEISYDLSNVFFITTANTTDNIPLALLDRMEIVEFPGYVTEEKVEIVLKHLVPKQILENSLTKRDLKFDRKTLEVIIQNYTYESGVRNLERQIGKLCRKVSKQKIENIEKISKKLTPDVVESYLGPPQYFPFKAENIDEVGGLREKTLAAHRSGLKKIIIPKKNIKDLVEIKDKVKKELEVILVDHMDDVIKIALHE